MQNLIEKAKAAFKPQPQAISKPAAQSTPQALDREIVPNGLQSKQRHADSPEIKEQYVPSSSEPKPEANLVAAPKSAKELAEETARQVGFRQGDEFANIRLCKAQTPRNSHMLYIENLPNWSARAICWVKDAESWKPVCPPHDKLKVKYTGMANVDGVLMFESSDISKRNRLRRAQ
jgi:hypothetical protein